MKLNVRLTVLAVLCTAALAMLLAACGNPGPERRTFVFTPVPYTVVPRDYCRVETCSRADFIDQDGERYAADQVSIVVREDAENQLRDLI